MAEASHIPAMRMPWDIRPERGEDAASIEALNAKSFGPGRFAKSAYRLRDGVAPVSSLSFVAIEDGILKGSVRFWPVMVGGAKSLLLGPLAVQSDQRGRGIGISLMRHGLDQARHEGWESVILIGDEPYYVRVGFVRVPPGRIVFPGPVDKGRILGLSLKANTMLTLMGQVRRAHIDDPVCADGAPLG